jgi:putative transposase
MPEHVHLLIYPRLPCLTKDILYGIKRPVGIKAIRYLKQQASDFLRELTVVSKNRTYCRFWQAGPGFDRNLTEPRAIHNTIDYIHENPVRRGLVPSAEDWIWSSARDLAGLDSPIPLRVDRTVPTLHLTDR